MAKTKSAYFCQSCGYESPKWLGKCPACSQWNTFVEEVIQKTNASVPDWKAGTSSVSARVTKPSLINDIIYQEDLERPEALK